MRRETADGHALAIWSDGSLTLGTLGHFLATLGTPRRTYKQVQRRRAVLALADDLALLDLSEVAPAIRRMEATFRYNWKSEGHRRMMVL